MRIVGGALSGRRLVAPKGDATRPTADRAREALFSVLGDVSGLAVLDLYAGTGAVGLEALSRGAARAVFVEEARPALEALRSNVASLAVGDRAIVLARSVERAAAALAPHGPFGLVFADPPWAKARDGSAFRAVEAIVAAGLVAPDGTVVVEHDAADEPREVAGVTRHETRRWGDTAATFFDASPRPDALYERPCPMNPRLPFRPPARPVAAVVATVSTLRSPR